MLKPLFLLLLSVNLFAIIPVKPREVGEYPGVTGEISGALETKRGNTDKDNYAGGVQLQYDNNSSYLVWGMINGAYGEASGVKDTNNLYFLLRYIENIQGKRLVKEYFSQIEEDEFKSIKDRVLIGAGLRAKLLQPRDGWGGLFFGLGAFAEYVGYSTGIDPAERNLRYNAYMAYSLRFGEDDKFVFGGYYQPKVDKIGDYIATLSALLEVHVYQQLYLGFTLNFSHDAKPAVGVKKEDFSQRTLFKYKF